MKKHTFIKLTCLALVLVFSMSFSFGANAAIDDNAIHNRITDIVSVSVADNDQNTYADGYDHGYIPVITTVQNSDGTYCVAINENNQNIQVFEIDKYTVTKSLRLTAELKEFAAFTKGTDGKYYALYAEQLSSSKKGVTALRLVKYSETGARLGALDIADDVEGSFMGIKKLCAGNSALYADDNYITGSIGRMMFSSDASGESHQSSYTFAVNTSSFTLVSKENSVIIPYASHSFHQMIVKDGSDYLYVDRGDAYPRAFQIVKMYGNTGWTKEEKVGTSFAFKGESGDNHTYSQLGGLVTSGSKYLLVGTYQNKTSSLNFSSANIFVQSFDKTTLAAGDVNYLTDYHDITGTNSSVTTVNNPKAVRISDTRIAIPYMVSNNVLGSEEMRVMFVDNNGNKIDDKSVHSLDGSAVIPRFGNVYYNSVSGAIEWFSIKNGKLALNALEECTNPAECPLGLPIATMTPFTDTLNLEHSEEVSIGLTITPANAINIVSWSSLDESVATVSGAGVVTATGAGLTKIVATAASGVTAEVAVNVSARVPVTGMNIIFGFPGEINFPARNTSIDRGTWIYYTVTATPSSATNTDYEVELSNTNVLRWVKSNDGFQAIGSGSCTVTFYSVSDPDVRQSYVITVPGTPTTTKPTTSTPTVPATQPSQPTQPTTQPARQSFFARLMSFFLSLFSWMK